MTNQPTFSRLPDSLSVMVLVIILTLNACSTGETTSDAAVEQEEYDAVQKVEVVTPVFKDFSAEILVSGSAMANRQVAIHAMENGVIKSVQADIGDYVKKGATLARLYNPELLRRKQQFEAELEGKTSTYNRLKSSFEASPAITPAQLLEDARAAYLSMQAQLDAVNDRLSFLTVRAPFSGVITKRMVDEGAVVQNGIMHPSAMPLFEIQDSNPIRLTIPLPERDAGFVQKGMMATITFPELPGASYNVPVSRSSNTLDVSSKTMQVELDINNEKGRIKPGMYAKAEMILSSREAVLSLPITAQVIYQNEPCVLIVADGIVARVSLRKGLSNKDHFEVLNPDITERTQVIIHGKGLVKPGDTVEAIKK